MLGCPGGHPDLLRPLAGMSWKLVPSHDEESEGELVLLGATSAMLGYLGQDAQNALRREEVCWTGDCFRLEPLADCMWIRYLCRRDDVLNHTSGTPHSPVQCFVIPF